MFEDLIRRLESMNGQTVSVPLETDDKGYVDKQCPSEECEFLFKLHADDWGSLVKDEAVWCPMCRHEAPANEWFTLAQVEHAKKQALAIVEGEVHNALISSAEQFNRNQPRNGFVSMTMKLEGGRVQTTILPAKAAQEMRLEITCEQCSCRFSVIGSAFFCPACGHNSVTQTFSDSLTKIRVKRDSLDTVRQAITESMGEDEAELACRSMLETCISDGVVAFQKFCEGLYVNFGTASFNVFQRLDQGSDLWAIAIGKGYGMWLDQSELAGLKVLYQKRHILSHNDGIVDAQYLAKSGDTSYKEGQRIVISSRDISEFLGYLDRLGTGLKAACGEP